MNIILYPFTFLGKMIMEALGNTGGAFLLFLESVRKIPVKPYRFGLVIKQMEFIGNKSLIIVMLIGFFTGMVFGLQCYIGLRRFGAEVMAGSIVSMAMIRELGPMLTGVMVAARAGSAITAELGTMKVTEQIDALKSMAVDPIQYLVTPRLIASAIVVPLLNSACIFLGLVGGYVVNVYFMGVNATLYYDYSTNYSKGIDIYHSMIKAFIFGMIVVTISCFYGLNTQMGSEGVGKATTKSVVESCVLILIFDYVITSILVA